MLLIFFAVEKVKMVYQWVTFLRTVLGHSCYSLFGCPSIPVRPQRKYIFGMSFPFFCLRLHLFFRSSTSFWLQNFFPSNGKKGLPQISKWHWRQKLNFLQSLTRVISDAILFFFFARSSRNVHTPACVTRDGAVFLKREHVSLARFTGGKNKESRIT